MQRHFTVKNTFHIITAITLMMAFFGTQSVIEAAENSTRTAQRRGDRSSQRRSRSAQDRNPRRQKSRYHSLVGDVTMQLSTNGNLKKMKINADGKSYTVIPRDNTKLSVKLHDIVRIIGLPHSDTEIREARVIILQKAEEPASETKESPRYFTHRDRPRGYGYDLVGDVYMFQSSGKNVKKMKIRVDGENYTIYPKKGNGLRGEPFNLETQDFVAVIDGDYEGNTIRDASVILLEKQNGEQVVIPYYSYIGEVMQINAPESFDILSEGKIYNVYPLTEIPRGLRVGDEVQAQGRRHGNNDIREAGVTVLQRR